MYQQFKLNSDTSNIEKNKKRKKKKDKRVKEQQISIDLQIEYSMSKLFNNDKL